MKPTSTLRSFLLSLAVVSIPTAHADILTWDNGDNTGEWNLTDENWSGLTWFNVPPDDAVFADDAVGAVTLTEDIIAGSITFNTAGYTIDTATFGLTINSGITANESASITSDPGGSILLGAANQWSVAADKTLAVSSPVSGGFNLNKTGAGTLELSGVSTYTGTFTDINEGTLRITGGDNRLPVTTAVRPANVAGATFDLNGFNQEIRRLALGGADGGLVTNTGSGTSTLTIRPDLQPSFAGVIEGDTRLEIVGSKTAPAFASPRQRIAGVSNTFTGGVVVDGGTLLAQEDGSLGAVPGTFDPAYITLQNNGTLLNNATGVPLLIHSNRGITLGPGGGAMAAAFDADLTVNSVISGDPGNPFTVVANGMILILTAENTYAGDTIVQPQSGVFNARLQLGNGGATGSLSGTSSIVNDGTLIINRNNDFTQATDLNNQPITGTGAFTQQGAGTTTLSVDNTYEGLTTVSGGMLLLISDEAIPGGLLVGNTGAAIRLSGGAVLGLGAGDFTRLPSGNANTAGRIAFGDNGGFAAFGADRIVNFGGASGIVAIGSTATTVLGSLNGKNLILGAPTATHKVTVTNTLDFGNASRTIIVNNGAAEVDAEISGVLQEQDGGFAGFTKAGTGTLLLSNDNTYSGTTNVSAGTLTIDGSLANANINISSGATLNGSGTLTFNIDGTTADQVLNDGIINLSGLTAAINPTGAGFTETEYILIDATGGGTITGTFAGLTGADDYVLDYETEGLVKLVGTPPTNPYEIWAGPGVPFDGDANGDGVSNGLAFLLGSPNPMANATGLLPTFSEQAGALTLNFDMLDSASRGDATLVLQYSGDLGMDDPWQDALVPDADDTVNDVAFTITGTGTLEVQATIPAGKALNNRLFARLKAIKP